MQASMGSLLVQSGLRGQLQEVDQFIGIDSKQRAARYLVRVRIGDAVQNTFGLSLNLGLGTSCFRKYIVCKYLLDNNLYYVSVFDGTGRPAHRRSESSG